MSEVPLYRRVPYGKLLACFQGNHPIIDLGPFVRSLLSLCPSDFPTTKRKGGLAALYGVNRGSHTQPIACHTIGVWGTGGDDVGLIESTKAPQHQSASWSDFWGVFARYRLPCDTELPSASS